MRSSRDRRQRALAWLLLLGLFACSQVDVAGTLTAESAEGEGRSGAAGTGLEPVPSDAEPGSEGAPCDGVSQWLTYSQLDLVSLATLGSSEGLPEEVELLFVDEDCSFWVRHAGTADDVRTGVLDASEAEELWSELGLEAWVGLQGQHGTPSSGTVRTIRDRTEELTCLGTCESPDVDAAVAAVFSIATEWVLRLYPRGVRFDGGVIAFGVPVGELPLATVAWPLDTPLQEFFGPGLSAPEEGIHLEAEDAEQLRQMKLQASSVNAAFGAVVVAEDLANARYAILIQEAGPTLP